YPHGIARLRFGELNGPAVVRHGLDWLLARAAGQELTVIEFHDGGHAGPGPFPMPELSPEEARSALRRLPEVRARGPREPLPYAPYSAWKYFHAGDEARAVKAARLQWHGSGHGGFAEGHGEALRVALRGCDPFADEAMLLRFADLAGTIFLALRTGKVY